MNKKSQFFIVSIVIMAFAILIISSYILTTDKSSVILFERSSFDDFLNIENSISERNDFLSENNWWNASWKARKSVTFTQINNTDEIDAQITASKINAGCLAEVRVTDSSGNIIKSNVTSDLTPCNVTFPASIATYYIYYNNSAAIQPSYRNIQRGNISNYLVGSELSLSEENLCDHLNYTLFNKPIKFSCTETLTDNQDQFNYSITFYSEDLKFSGSIL